MNNNHKRNKISGKTLKRLLGFISGKYKVIFAVVVLCIVISAIAGVVGSMFIKTLVDDYITPLLLTPNPVYTGLLKAILTMGMIYLAGVLCALIYNRLMVVVAQSVLKKVRDKLFGHMQSLPIKYFDTHTHGDVMSRYTNDTDTLTDMLTQSIPQALQSVVTIAAVTFAMLSISWIMSLFVLVFVVIMLLTAMKIGKKSAGYFRKQQAAIGNLNGFAEEMISGQNVIKVFNHESISKQEFEVKNQNLRKNSASANTFANIIMPIMGNLGNLQYVLIAVFGGLLAIKGIGGITLGAIASFLLLSKSFSQPISQVSMQVNSIIMAMAGAQRIFTMLDEQPEADNGFVTLVNARREGGGVAPCDEYTGIKAWRHPQADGSVTYSELKGDVRFQNVDFGYRAESTVLNNVSLFAKPGDKIAFVGATGAGKTTITNLINRFYDIADGTITFDGINISNIKKSDLRRALGVVLQDTNLFTGTVADNIRYGNLDATRDDIEKAAQLANAHDFIMRLPEGYDTVIPGDGGNLSQGQRQLLSIARAAVANPPVMILDEATSSIDTRTELLVQKGMDGLMRGRTVFVIAHRLSTVKNADAIIVLEQGRIIERGNHNALIKAKGKYCQLYTGSFAD